MCFAYLWMRSHSNIPWKISFIVSCDFIIQLKVPAPCHVLIHNEYNVFFLLHQTYERCTDSITAKTQFSLTLSLQLNAPVPIIVCWGFCVINWFVLESTESLWSLDINWYLCIVCIDFYIRFAFVLYHFYQGSSPAMLLAVVLFVIFLCLWNLNDFLWD